MANDLEPTSAARREQWLRDAETLGREIKRLHDEALALGDAHEARHLFAALKAGNSDPCVDRCVLVVAQTATHEGD